MKYDILIVGGGHGGAQAAIALRQAKFDGTIGIFTNEEFMPYERPPLSKDYLAGEKTFDRILIRPESFWTEREVDIHLRSRICKVDADLHTVSLDDGTQYGYGQLIWAAGGSPRWLSCPGAQYSAVHVIRNRDDVDAIMDGLDKVKNITIIGGGFIGLEAAAVLRKMDKNITLIEAQDRLLARVAGPQISEFYLQEHRAHGVDVRLDAKVESIIGPAPSDIEAGQEDAGPGHLTGVQLSSGEIIKSDIVIVGIGIIPTVNALRDAGAICANGVDVDELCRTSLPDVFAIGDCASHANKYADGAVMRVESVQNANDMASAVAKTIAGTDTPYDAVPWFWSNQYDLRMQTVGLSVDYDDIILRGDLAQRSFSLIYLKQSKIIALDCVNATKDYVQGRKLVVNGDKIDPVLLADTDIQLKEMQVG